MGENNSTTLVSVRSKGVTFWGWAFILSSVLGILNLWQLSPFLLIVTFLSSIAYIICAIFILKLNEAGRKAAIILGIISIILIPFYLQDALKGIHAEEMYEKQKQAIIETVKPEHQKEALIKLETQQKTMEEKFPLIVGIIVGIPVLFIELIPIWFFTRSKVKEQFK